MKKRAEEVVTLTGQRAYEFYGDWHRLQNRRTPGIDVFVKSSAYKPMFNFANMVKKLNIPNTDIFINLMIKDGLQPSSWSSDIAYAHFIKYMDRRLKASDQMEITVNTILDICDANTVDPSEFFSVITPNKFMQMVIQRKLSPWILYHSKKFLKYYSDEFTQYHQNMFAELHPPHDWKAKFEKKPKQVELMKKVIKELEL